MRGRNVAHVGCFLGGAIVGARLMYLFDPDRGNARRAVVRDKFRRGIHLFQREGNKQLRNIGNHLLGGIKELRSTVRDRARNLDEDILLERVRAQLGRDVQHLRMLDFSVQNGCMVVSGPVLHGEADKIRRKLHKIRGVHDCDVRVEEVGQEEMERRSGQRGFSPQRVAM